MNGSFCGKLIFTINKKDFDPMLCLYEKKSDGTYVYLSNFMCRASMNADRTKRNLLTPGKTYDVIINNSFMISRKIEQGSKLVLLLGIDILDVGLNPSNILNDNRQLAWMELTLYFPKMK